MKNFVLPLLLCLALSIGPSLANDSAESRAFLIDRSKHYVYLKFDHVGEREPLSQDELSKGLWLRLVNNCRIPIVVAIFDTGPDNRGVGVFDEVVPILNKRLLPVSDLPDQRKTQTEPAEPTQEEPPEGYSPPDFISTTIIPPRRDLLFSVPLNHVGPTWYLQIRFYFALPGDGYGTGPYSVVSFDWQDIPEKFRQPDSSPASARPTMP
jgi:hypothetical protein